MLRQQAERLPRSKTTPQSLGRCPAQLALDQNTVVVCRIDAGEPEAQLDTARTHELTQALEAGNHLVALVAADQRRRHSTAAPQLRLRDSGAFPCLNQEIAAEHAASLTPDMCSRRQPCLKGGTLMHDLG